MVKQRVSYFYDTDVGHFYYGPGHPMKPHRIKMAHHLILSTGLYRKLDVYRPHLAAPLEMTRFHSDDYVKFLDQRHIANAVLVFVLQNARHFFMNLLSDSVGT